MNVSPSPAGHLFFDRFEKFVFKKKLDRNFQISDFKNRKIENFENRKIFEGFQLKFFEFSNFGIFGFSEKFQLKSFDFFRFSKFSIFRFFENFPTSPIFFDQNFCEFFTENFFKVVFFHPENRISYAKNDGNATPGTII